MDFLPIFIDVRNRDCMVVGGGEVAARKAALLLRAGARVTIIAPRLCEELNSRLSEQRREQPETTGASKDHTSCGSVSF